MITRRKDDLVVDHATAQPVAGTPVNQGVVRDERLAQRSSPAVWRRITIETDAAEEVAFPTKELDIEPGVLAFLYLRRAEPLGEHESPRWTAVAYRYLQDQPPSASLLETLFSEKNPLTCYTSDNSSRCSWPICEGNRTPLVLPISNDRGPRRGRLHAALHVGRVSTRRVDHPTTDLQFFPLTVP